MCFVLIKFINRSAACLSGALSVWDIYCKYGFPQFTSAYCSRVIPDPLTFGVFLGFFNMVGNPYLLALLPIFLTEVTAFTSQLLHV
jgi:hypothetical protein